MLNIILLLCAEQLREFFVPLLVFSYIYVRTYIVFVVFIWAWQNSKRKCNKMNSPNSNKTPHKMLLSAYCFQTTHINLSFFFFGKHMNLMSFQVKFKFQLLSVVFSWRELRIFFSFKLFVHLICFNRFVVFFSSAFPLSYFYWHYHFSSASSFLYFYWLDVSSHRHICVCNCDVIFKDRFVKFVKSH